MSQQIYSLPRLTTSVPLQLFSALSLRTTHVRWLFGDQSVKRRGRFHLSNSKLPVFSQPKARSFNDVIVFVFVFFCCVATDHTKELKGQSNP